MKNIKRSFLVLVSFLIIVFSSPISASASIGAGVKPGSFFYFFDTTFENISLFFTFNSESKVKKALKHADERLAEVEALVEDKNPNAVKTAITNYESNIALAAEKSKEVQDKERAENLFTLISDNTSKNQEVLSAVLIKVPEEAKEAITRAIEISRKGQEEATQKIAEFKGGIEQLKKEVAELKEKGGEQEETIEELSKQKSENKYVPSSQNLENIQKQPSETNIGDLGEGAKIAQTKEDLKKLGEIVEKQRNVYLEWINTLTEANDDAKSAIVSFKTRLEKEKNIFLSYSSGLEDVISKESKLKRMLQESRSGQQLLVEELRQQGIPAAGIRAAQIEDARARVILEQEIITELGLLQEEKQYKTATKLGADLMLEYLIQADRISSFSNSIQVAIQFAKNVVMGASDFNNSKMYESSFKEISGNITAVTESYNTLVQNYNSGISQVTNVISNYNSLPTPNSYYYQPQPLKTCVFSIEGSVIKDYYSGSVECYPF